MALTKISTAGVKDDIVTTAKIADDAITSALIADDGVIQAAIADEAVDEARLQISNAGSNGQFLSKQSGNTGGLTWATPPDTNTQLTLVDEDDMSSNSATSVPSQQSVKAYVDTTVKSIPSSAKSSAYVLVAGDAGTAIYISTGGVTINNSVFSAGNAVTIINNSGSDQTITQGSGVTMHNAADAATGNRTLAARGMATIWFASASVCYISGAGLS